MTAPAPKFVISQQHLQLTLSVIALVTVVFGATTWFVRTDQKAELNSVGLTELRTDLAAETTALREDLRVQIQSSAQSADKFGVQVEKLSDAVTNLSLVVKGIEVTQQRADQSGAFKR